MKESQTGGRRKRKQQKRLCFSECVQQGKKFLAFSKGRIHQQMPLLFCQGKRSTLRTVLPSLLGRHLLAQPWGRRKYHLSSTEASLMVLLLARLFGFSLLLFQPCSHCPIYACSPRCVQQTSEGLLYRRAACALPLPQELFRSVFKRQERSPQPHFPCDAHFTRTSLLLCITPQWSPEKAYLQPSALPSILFFLLTHPSSYHRPLWEIKKHCISCPFLYAKSSLQVGLCSLGQADEPHPAAGAHPASGSVSWLSGASRETGGFVPQLKLGAQRAPRAESSCLPFASPALRSVSPASMRPRAAAPL